MGDPPGFEGDVDSDDEREKKRRARGPQKVTVEVEVRSEWAVSCFLLGGLVLLGVRRCW